MSVCRLAVLASSAIAPLALALGACNRSAPPASSSTRGDSAFAALSQEILHDYFRRHPSASTQLGVHDYDSVLDDVRASAFGDEARADSSFRARLLAVDTTRLSLDQELDRQQLIHAMDAAVLTDRVIKPFAANPDFYSSGATSAAYVIMEREYAPANQRLTALVARENAMPAALVQSRTNLVNPPRIFTEIAIEQLDGDVNFFKNDVTAAFKSVTDTALVRRFNASNAAVIKALAVYKTYLQHDVLPKSTGNFALGPDTYAKELAAAEMVDVPLPRLVAIAESDRQKNEAAFQAAARLIDSTKPAEWCWRPCSASTPRLTNSSPRRRTCSTRFASSSSIITSRRFHRRSRRA